MCNKSIAFLLPPTRGKKKLSLQVIRHSDVKSTAVNFLQAFYFGVDRSRNNFNQYLLFESIWQDTLAFYFGKP